MELEFDGVRWSQDGGGFWVSLRVKAPMAAKRFVDAFSGKPHLAKLSRKRSRRSLDANAYAWVLLDKLSEALSREGETISPEEIYRRLIPYVGKNSRIVPVREEAAEEWRVIWRSGRCGWVCEDLGECRTLPGYRNLRCYYGSSLYDTEQMRRLLQLIVQECRQIGIETATPEELRRMEGLWEHE